MAIVVLGNFIRDAIEVVVDTQFNLSLRGDVSVWAADPLDDGVRHSLARLPGVTQIEATRMVVPKSYDPLFHMFEDMEGFKKRMLDPFVSEEAYNKIPVQVRRWPHERPRKKGASKQAKNILACSCND